MTADEKAVIAFFAPRFAGAAKLARLLIP